MKIYCVVLLLAAVVFVECGHTFSGTSHLRPIAYHTEARYSANMFTKRIEYLNYTLPPALANNNIQGILAYDLTDTGASANITAGGVGWKFVNLRMKSDRGQRIHYDIYIHV